jgi:hypothetical protein
MCCIVRVVGLYRDLHFLKCSIIKIYMIIFRMTLINQCDRNPYLNLMQPGHIALRTYRIQCNLV